MDVNKLKKAQDLLEKSQAAENVIEALKNLNEDKNWATSDYHKFLDGIYKIKQDFYVKIIELKTEYDKEFDSL